MRRQLDADASSTMRRLQRNRLQQLHAGADLAFNSTLILLARLTYLNRAADHDDSGHDDSYDEEGEDDDFESTIFHVVETQDSEDHFYREYDKVKN